MKYIHFFRRDLRIQDNDALSYAIDNGTEVMPVFVLDPYFKESELNGLMRYRFLLESLIDLDIQLKGLNLELKIIHGNTVDVIESLIGDGVGLTFNYDVQVDYGRKRDEELIEYCRDNGIDLYIGLNQYTKVDDFVFDKWFEDHASYLELDLHVAKESKLYQPNIDLEYVDISSILSKLDKSDLYTGGNKEASQALNTFLNKDFDNYYWQLSRPYLAQIGHTSHLSAHIAFGTISTRQVYKLTKAYLASKPNYKKKNMSGRAFLERLRWRDGFTNRLVFHPEIQWGNKFKEFDSHYSLYLTKDQDRLLQLWKEGNTGYPLIDAAMRQLRKDGWMIFRLRAMCASFLCFHLGVSWHYGAVHFMNYLVDGDIAINHWQWQMQAGATDPYNPIFRVYNPTKNIPERDPKLEYIHYWVPESKDCLTIDELMIKFPTNQEFESNMKKNKLSISQIRKSMRNKYLGIDEPQVIEDDQIELF
jgi:deoxyribodipyrimidine photo-lyase